MSGVALMITFIIAVAIMIVAISKFRVHPFMAIMGISLLLAIVVGIPLGDIPGTIGAGFSGTFSSIGIVIILGAVIGIILEKTGAAIKLADMVVELVGKKRPELAIMLMGWIVSVPVFCDSGFVILNPIRKAMRKKTMTSSVAMTVALSAGLYTSHVFIPPTPGPIAAAGSVGLGSNLLLIIGMGILVSIPCLIAAYFYAKYIGTKVKASDEVTNDEIVKTYEELVKEYGELPGGMASIAPILVPILLMALSSISAMAGWEGAFASLLTFLGTPIIALTVGLLCGIGLLASIKKMNVFNELTENTLKTVGPILFITAAGGVLGKVITTAGFVTYIQENASFLSSVGIFFPFLIAAILKTAQGSSTVAITTTAAIMGAYSESGTMMSALGLTTPVAAALTVMAIGAGAMTVSHANDSYFWVVTNLGEMKPQDGYKTQTMVTLIMGIVSILFIFLLSLFLL
ncbi:GntP family permease [Defluviitalea raffinosedens]|jgi:GntP family gluconate:H+ symporter|uniref:GntP family permease n=1 Tax=Defluviitalea raffinosedens TaxID=1450156 RepID=A0A7C8LGB7_9FIRM|nr:GntP family permease [Defluviitalea raffinosedens]KAE9636856.1 GntP family permease [Defluviitalea raffinosedens]MBM7686373.1 GntP family gluconate:H+ symporter [Defluviitalea raffinosedens]MBZ4668882.1 H+/gluconate symporter family protein [Defluviitaleaceae bacterium]HHW67161.1 GntP family permease [Candidatus Epulonipiscium sp.]